MPAEAVPQALEMFKSENQGGGIGSFQQRQNQERIEFIESEIERKLRNLDTLQDSLSEQDDQILDARAEGDEDRVTDLQTAKAAIQERISELYATIEEKAGEIALTDEQREKLAGDNEFDGGEFAMEFGWTLFKAGLSLVPGFGTAIAGLEVSETLFRETIKQTDGSLTERLTQAMDILVDSDQTGEETDKVEF
jgi:TolA-binding protein